MSRILLKDHLNFGFSGSAKGESAIAEYISTLDMSAFIYDYDYNAPSVEHLEMTHSKMYEIIRSKNPEVPIICVSRPSLYTTLSSDEERRRAVIKNTVSSAKRQGDKNIFFVDGRTFSEKFGFGDCFTVDGVHPNDFGFVLMAKYFCEKLKELGVE